MDNFLSFKQPILEETKQRELMFRRWESICKNMSGKVEDKYKSVKKIDKNESLCCKPFWKSLIYRHNDGSKSSRTSTLEQKFISILLNEEDEISKVVNKVVVQDPEFYKKLDLFYDHSKEWDTAKNVSEYFYGYKYFVGLRSKKTMIKMSFLSNHGNNMNRIHHRNENSLMTNQKITRFNRGLRTDTDDQSTLPEKRTRRSHKKKKSIMNEELFKSLNCLEKRSHKRKSKDPVNQLDTNLDGNSGNADTFKEKSFLPTGVFYSRICRSIIANWIDEKTKRQVKVPFKIMDYGLQKCSIYAIIARCLRIAELEKIIEQYNNLSEDQINKILTAMSEAAWPEKMYTAIIQGEYEEYMKIEKRFASLMNLSKSDDSFNPMWKQNKTKEDDYEEEPEEESRKKEEQKAKEEEQQRKEKMKEQQKEKLKEQEKTPSNENNILTNGTMKTIEEKPKGRPQKRTKSKADTNKDKDNNQGEKKRIKTSDADGPLPIGVYFYQGAYVANWWETTVKKQHKVPFKISEYGGKLAKTLAVVSRTLRSSNVNDVKLILTKMDTQENCIKLDYLSLASMAIKTYRSLKGKKYPVMNNTNNVNVNNMNNIAINNVNSKKI